MDILNFISWIKEKRVITATPKGSLLAVGTPTARRDDGYLVNAVTVADAVASGAQENNTYKTGIYDQYPFPVTPYMIPTSTKIEDTPAAPTFYQGNLVGYKVAGVYELGSANDTFIIEYLGTVETTDGSYLSIFPWQTSGTVTSTPNAPMPTPIVCAFANGASISDDNDDLVPAEIMTIAIDQYAPDGADIYLVAVSQTAVYKIYGDASFNFEFLTVEGTPLKFTLY